MRSVQNDGMFGSLGADWLAEMVGNWTDTIDHVSPVDFNEQNRYLPDSASRMPGYISYGVSPYMREILNACDPRSPVREVNLKKGVQIMYTTLLESVLLYFMACIKTQPCMMISADKELVTGRIENYVLPMLAQSGLAHLITSSDEGNSRKTGKTKDHLQWTGGGFLVPGGANNADKMRMWSIMLMLKDELDAWQDIVGKDGDPDALTDDRCAAFWDVRKIYRGGTPLISGSSKIQFQYLRGDQRKYKVLCKHCGYPQELRWETANKETGVRGGFMWETDGGILLPESVQYLCQDCGRPHYEHDKTALFAEENGAAWVPTARPAEQGIRSYHLPAFYSPVGFQPWHKCVGSYLKGFDPVTKKVTNISKYQVFYNNILGEPFKVLGSRIRFESVSAHRRAVYRLGEIPNAYAAEYAGSRVLFLTCTVDVHKNNLRIAVIGWTAHGRNFLVQYWRFEDDDCTQASSPVWGRLREVIEERRWVSDDERTYGVVLTLIDASYSNDTVVGFCSDYEHGVYPILGRDRPGKNQSIREFAEFTTPLGTVGFRITVDHYKDRMAPVLRREWTESQGVQREHHFNVPIDTKDAVLKELTTETRSSKTDERGNTTYYWHRPGNAPNEMFDLLGYGFAAVDLLAWDTCINRFELKTVDWAQFWEYAAIDGVFSTE